MFKPGSRTLVALGAVVAISGVIPAAGLLHAQVRKCYVESCTEINGKLYCAEHEIPCPSQT
ncbi:MAG TPA: hypothetical protein VF665_07325 [Longimicrobium sp.]|jgi:hypothetical protein|uniref:hypothetical protein n=1 Tax=Longimicrobium sp. TaxID=2029185 RepID=UPI002EDB4947